MKTPGDSVEIRTVIIYVRHVTHKTTFCGGVRRAWPLCVVSHVLLFACTINIAQSYGATIHMLL
jgi:hypothetical protein